MGRVFEGPSQLTSQNSYFTAPSEVDAPQPKNKTESPLDRPSELYEKEYQLIAFIMAGCGVFLIVSGSGFIFCNWRVKRQRRLKEEATRKRNAKREDEIRRAKRAKRGSNEAFNEV